MRCPWCNSRTLKTLDSRAIQDGRVVRRRRECRNKHRFTTREVYWPEFNHHLLDGLMDAIMKIAYDEAGKGVKDEGPMGNHPIPQGEADRAGR